MRWRIRFVLGVVGRNASMVQHSDSLASASSTSISRKQKSTAATPSPGARLRAVARDGIALFKLGFRDGLRRPVGEPTLMVAAAGSAFVTAVGLILYAWLG